MTKAELKAVLAVLDEVRHVLPVNWGSRADAIRDKYRAQLAALPPEPEQPWTDRERRLREVLETCAKLIKAEWFIEDCPTNESPRMEYEAATAALAEAPPPDLRDEALEAAEKALETAVKFGDCATFRVRRNDALAAIARAKRGK